MAEISATILTCSFRGDFEYCKILCESIDRFVPATVEHVLVVPVRDMALFKPLSNSRRRIVPENEVLPAWMKKLPLPPADWRASLGLPRRDFYIGPGLRIVRGWIVQQIKKICAASQMSSEVIVHLDSDTAMIRHFDASTLMRGDRVMIYQNPKIVAIETHHEYHRAAARLFGLPPLATTEREYDYIDQMVVWRRSIVRRMIETIEAVNKEDAAKVLARTPLFAEYVLYGTFAERMIGLDEAGLAIEPESLCHSRWVDDFTGPEDEARFVQSVGPRHVACLLQSTLNLSLGDRRRILSEVTDYAARQDAAAIPS